MNAMRFSDRIEAGRELDGITRRDPLGQVLADARETKGAERRVLPARVWPARRTS